jgi:hypothetical protein
MLGVQRMEAMIYAIGEVNKNPKILPGAIFGLK